MDLLNHGRVITIDITDRGRPPHPRITYLRGFSTSPDIVATVKNAITPSERVMVVLDSDHSAENVRKELRTYGPLVTVGAYLVVEDTNINGHPVLTGYGPGPAEALEDFLKTDSGFVRDPSRERFLLTFNPGGFLKKTR
jgi:cephalosporin hydroxylase